MTQNKKSKKAARKYAKDYGVSYTAGLRATSLDEEPWEFMTTDQLLRGGVLGGCDDLLEMELRDFGGVELTAEVPLLEPYVFEVNVDLDTMLNYPVETYDGGAEVSNVHVQAAVNFAGLTSKGEATMLAEEGLVEPLDWDYSRHDAHVILTTPYKVQLEFDATYTVDAESVEDFVFSGATLLR